MNQMFHIELEIQGVQLSVIEVVIEEGISRVGGARALVSASTDLESDAWIDADATLRFIEHGLVVREIRRKVSAVSFVGVHDGVLRYAFDLKSTFWFLQLGKNVRKFRDQPTEAIVSTVLAENGVRFAWRTTRPTASRPYLVQYRETHFDLVQRLLEYEGIYYFFEDDGTMVLGDASGSADDVADGLATYALLTAEGALTETARGVIDFALVSAVGSGRATVNDYDWKKPSTSLLQSSSGQRNQELEVYDYPTGYRDPAIGAILAKLRVEALEAPKRTAEGRSTVWAFDVHRAFTFAHEEVVSFSGRYVITAIRHTYRAETPSGEPAHYENEIEALPGDVPFRPPLSTPRPTVAGNHTAMVRGPAAEEIHTDAFGRAKVQFHWDREAKGTDEDSRWIRVLQETSSSQGLARVGWEMSVGYVDGDPDRPVGLARQINGVMTPTYGQPFSKNVMAIKTESYPGKAGHNELRLDDSASAMRMEIYAERDLENVVQHDKTEKVGRDSTHLVKSGLDRTVGKTQEVQVGTDETIRVSGDHKHTVAKDRSETVGGSEKVNVAKSLNVNVDGNDSETVGGIRITKTGTFAVNIPSAKELLKSLVPTPEDVMGTAAGAVFGSKVGGLVKDVASGKAPDKALQGIATSVATSLGTTVGGKDAGRAAGQLASGAMSGKSGLAEAGRTLVEGALTGTLKAPGGPVDIGAALGKGLGLPTAAPDVAGALAKMVPTPSSILSKATGGLSDVRSVGDLAKFCKGSINRSSGQRHTKMVGGAYVKIAAEPIKEEANKLAVELVGGLRLAVSAKGGIPQTSALHLARAVGGIAIRKSKGDMSTTSQVSKVTVGASATVHSDEKVEVRSKVIELEAGASFKLQSGDVAIELTPAGATIQGKLKWKAGSGITVVGNPDKLT
jgi:type VI secretion system secreted protein VgrG